MRWEAGEYWLGFFGFSDKELYFESDSSFLTQIFSDICLVLLFLSCSLSAAEVVLN